MIFNWVLADCAVHIEEPGWRHLADDRYERLIADAYRHFFGVQAQIHVDASII